MNLKIIEFISMLSLMYVSGQHLADQYSGSHPNIEGIDV